MKVSKQWACYDFDGNDSRNGINSLKLQFQFYNIHTNNLAGVHFWMNKTQCQNITQRKNSERCYKKGSKRKFSTKNFETEDY